MYQESQTGGVVSRRPVGEVHVRVFPALSRMVTWHVLLSLVTVQFPPATSIQESPSVDHESRKVIEVFPHPWPEGSQVQQLGRAVSMRAVGDVHERVFPALSSIVTLQVSPLDVAVQSPPSTLMPLSASVEFERVKRTLPLAHAVPEGFQSPQTGSVLSEFGCTAKAVA